MLEKSAMPYKIKRTTLTQETIRILRNCRRDLPWEEKAAFLTDHSRRMKASGYAEKFREEVIISGIRGFEKMVEVEEAGGRPVNRARSWEQKTRSKKKKEKSITWHKSGGFDVPLFIPCTPNGELAKRVKEAEARTSRGRPVRFKIVETGGIAIKNQLQKSDPWAGDNCGHEDCFPCQGENGGDCRRSSVTYQIVCLKCQDGMVVAHYKGETARNMFTRGREHMRQFNRRDKASCMWAHCVKYHESRPVQFKMELTGTFSKSHRRQVAEGVQIRTFPGVTINRRSEWRLPAVSRMVFVNHVDND